MTLRTRVGGVSFAKNRGAGGVTRGALKLILRYATRPDRRRDLRDRPNVEKERVDVENDHSDMEKERVEAEKERGDMEKDHVDV